MQRKKVEVDILSFGSFLVGCNVCQGWDLYYTVMRNWMNTIMMLFFDTLSYFLGEKLRFFDVRVLSQNGCSDFVQIRNYHKAFLQMHISHLHEESCRLVEGLRSRS